MIGSIHFHNVITITIASRTQVLSMSYALTAADTYRNLRDIYYMNVELFGRQQTVNDAVDDIVHLAKVHIFLSTMVAQINLLSLLLRSRESLFTFWAARTGWSLESCSSSTLMETRLMCQQCISAMYPAFPLEYQK